MIPGSNMLAAIVIVFLDSNWKRRIRWLMLNSEQETGLEIWDFLAGSRHLPSWRAGTDVQLECEARHRHIGQEFTTTSVQQIKHASLTLSCRIGDSRIIGAGVQGYESVLDVLE